MQQTKPDTLSIYDPRLADPLNLVIYRYLGLGDLAHLARVSRYFKDYCYDNRYWQEKYRIHFSHLLNGDEPKDTNWQQVFAHRAAYEYRIFNRHKTIFRPDKEIIIKESKACHQKRIKLLIAFKEGDVATLEYYRANNQLNIDDLYAIIDKNKIDVIQWAIKKNRKAVLAYVFNSIILPFYTASSKIDDNVKKVNYWQRDSKDASIVNWAIKCHQNNFLKQAVSQFDNPENFLILNLVKKLSEINIELLKKRSVKKSFDSYLLIFKNNYCCLARELFYCAMNYNNVDFFEILRSDSAKEHLDGYQKSVTEWFDTYSFEKISSMFGFFWITSNQELASTMMHNNVETYLAANYGCISAFKASLVNNEVKAHSVTDQKNSSLSASAKHGHIAIAKELIDLGVNIEQINIKGKTPLYLAAQRGHAAVVDLLLDHGANPEKCDAQSRSMINVTAEHGHVDIAIKLLMHAPQCTAQGYRLNNINVTNNVIENLSKKVKALLEKRMLAFAEQKFQTNAAKQNFIINFRKEKFDNVINKIDQNDLLKILMANQQDLDAIKNTIIDNNTQENNRKSLGQYYDDYNLNFEHHFEQSCRERSVALIPTLKGLKQICLTYQRHLDGYTHDNDYSLENKRQNLQSLLAIINARNLSNIDKVFQFSEKFASYAEIFNLMRSNEEQGFINSIRRLLATVVKNTLSNMGFFKVKGREAVEQIKENLNHCPIAIAAA